ncbi:LysM peptidoglycan-binding domain-containing protein [uncultured Alistipes sp.]|uniref:LysM peptidoglycan-binding domain-containing protein n=1 Tax=uncultured Alistipes sp. TaxID=538949 RepID=UPI0026366BFC|nr:LysM peptidoglycan-binding domain-containing protein [uncultured Alistipes sp.]
MKRSILITILSLVMGWSSAGAAAPQSEKSQTIVYIGGQKFYIHTVKQGDTLYSLARLYGVAEQTLLDHNPTLADVIKIDQNIKIPLPQPQPQPEKPLTAKEEKKLRRKYLLHTIEAHETLFAISRRYGISVETLMKDNKDLDPAHLTIGSTLLVRKKEVGKTSNAENLAELERYKERLNSVTAADSCRYYVVRPGDTIYSLAQANGISEQELSALNDGLTPQTLKAGALIKLPAAAYAATPAQPADTVQVAERIGEITPLAPDSALDISLLLPATTNGRPNSSYTEFYQGFLLGLEDLRNDGRSVRLEVFDTSHDRQKVDRIVEDPAFLRSRLIVGPVYEDELPPVLACAEQKGIPVVSPLATIEHTHSALLFQMAPDPDEKYAKLRPLLNSGRRVVLIYGKKNDAAFEEAVKAMIPSVGYGTYRYEAGSNMGDLLSSRDAAVFVVLASSETEVDTILAALASATSNIVARGHSVPQYEVIGGSHWNRFDNIDRNLFFKNRVTLMSTYHARRDNAGIRAFDKRYITAFGSMPTLFSYRGYDAAVLFGEAMFEDAEEKLDEQALFRPLQTPYRFRQEAESGIRTNTEWVLVSYERDYTIRIQ